MRHLKFTLCGLKDASLGPFLRVLHTTNISYYGGVSGLVACYIVYTVYPRLPYMATLIEITTQYVGSDTEQACYIVHVVTVQHSTFHVVACIPAVRTTLVLCIATLFPSS